MGLPTALLALVTIALAALSGADATLEAVCKAASGKDARVDYNFCVSQLGSTRWAPDGDAWAYAKIAADAGVNNAYLAVQDIQGILAKPDTDAKTKAPLEQCDGFYGSMKLAFANANDRISERHYAAGKEEAAKAIDLAHQCDDAFATAAVWSPLARRSDFSVQIAIVCTAITSLLE